MKKNFENTYIGAYAIIMLIVLILVLLGYSKLLYPYELQNKAVSLVEPEMLRSVVVWYKTIEEGTRGFMLMIFFFIPFSIVIYLKKMQRSKGVLVINYVLLVFFALWILTLTIAEKSEILFKTLFEFFLKIHRVPYPDNPDLQTIMSLHFFADHMPYLAAIVILLVSAFPFLLRIRRKEDLKVDSFKVLSYLFIAVLVRVSFHLCVESDTFLHKLGFGNGKDVQIELIYIVKDIMKSCFWYFDFPIVFCIVILAIFIFQQKISYMKMMISAGILLITGHLIVACGVGVGVNSYMKRYGVKLGEIYQAKANDIIGSQIMGIIFAEVLFTYILIEILYKKCLWYHGLIAVLVLGTGSFFAMRQCNEVAELGKEICFVALDVFAVFFLIFKLKDVWQRKCN